MTVTILSREQLHLHITTDSLGFADTSELLHKTLPWVGQERAEEAEKPGRDECNRHDGARVRLARSARVLATRVGDATTPRRFRVTRAPPCGNARSR